MGECRGGRGGVTSAPSSAQTDKSITAARRAAAPPGGASVTLGGAWGGGGAVSTVESWKQRLW